MVYNLAYMRDVFKIFASNGLGFVGRTIGWSQSNSTASDPCCHGNKIWDINGLKFSLY